MPQGISCKRALDVARALARGEVPRGYSCIVSRPKSKPRNRIIWVCGRGGTPGTNTAPPRGNVGNVVTLIPGGAFNCADVVYLGRRYAVFGRNVT